MVVKVLVFLAIMIFALGASVWLGLWIARKQGSIPRDGSGIGHLRAALRRQRQRRRELLTRGERIFAWTMLFLSVTLAPVGVIILLSGDSSLRPVGIAMLVLALIVMTVPISPVLQARVRRRQRTSSRR